MRSLCLIRLIAFADGEIRLSDAQQAFGALDRGYFSDLSEAVFQQDALRCFELLDKAFSQSLDLRTFVADFVSHWRALLLIAHTTDAGASEETWKATRESLSFEEENFSRLREQAGTGASFYLNQLFDLADTTAGRAGASAYPRFVFEAGLSKMASLPLMKPLAEILSGVSDSSAGSTGANSTQARSTQARSTLADSPVKKKNRQQAEPAESVVSEESTPAEPEGTAEAGNSPARDFVPSWKEFIIHVSSRRSPVLEATLRQVSPKEFLFGRLSLAGTAYFVEQLGEKETQKLLRECLHSYSGSDDWTILLEEQAPQPERSGEQPQSASTRQPVRAAGRNLSPKRASVAAGGFDSGGGS